MDDLNGADFESKTAHTKLVVTFFARSRPCQDQLLSVAPSENGLRDDSLLPEISTACKIPFTNLLSSLISPSPLTLLSSQSRSPHVFQLTYLTSAHLDPFSIRHDAFISSFEKANFVEVVFDLLPDATKSHRQIKLAIFDMDSTLINEEVIDELARSISVTPAVSAITTRAMNGEIDFEQSLRDRLALLRGVDIEIWKKLEKSITIAAGATELCVELRRRGIVTAVASGGFAPMADWLKAQLGLDYAFANHLIDSPPNASYPYLHLSGHLSPHHPIITPTEKRQILLSLAAKYDTPLSQTMAVGDGSNDLLMLNAAGLGVAWRAKEKVQREAPQRLNGHNLTELLFLLEPRDRA